MNLPTVALLSDTLRRTRDSWCRLYGLTALSFFRVHFADNVPKYQEEGQFALDLVKWS